MELPKRKNIRLADYNYSSNGAYFITICTKDRQKLFGTVVGAPLAAPEKTPEFHCRNMGTLLMCTLKPFTNITKKFALINTQSDGKI